MGITTFRPSKYELEVVRGNVPGVSFVEKFGKNPEVDNNGATEDIWTFGGTYPFLPVALQLAVVSDDANDTNGGTGANTVEVEYLDTSYDKVTEIVTMNGATPVNLANLSTRVNRVKVATAGSATTNVGNIYVAIGFIIQAQIPPGEGQTFQAIYTVPNGHEGYLTRFWGTVGASLAASGEKEGLLTLFVRPFGGAFQAKDTISLNSRAGLPPRIYDYPLFVDEKSDIKLTFQSNKNNTLVTGNFALELDTK